MQTVTFMSAFVLAAVVLLTAPPAVDAVCCHPTPGFFTCRDCTRSTPYCGRGPCNIFGCDCSGGCRSGNCNKRSVDEQVKDDRSLEAEEIVSAGDMNGDGVLSVEEAETMLQEGVHRRHVRSLDKNMDGMLTADEIDN